MNYSMNYFQAGVTCICLNKVAEKLLSEPGYCHINCVLDGEPCGGIKAWDVYQIENHMGSYSRDQQNAVEG